MGYTPLFDTLTKGTLCGRWPDIGLWPIVLSMSDKNGVIDATQHYIAGVTGLPLADVEACMKRFCEPDPYSRSQDAGGARLVLIDAHREWGWQVVNHAKYKERARLAGKNARDVESGSNALRMQDRRRPPETAAHPLSDAYADSNTDKEKERAPAREPPPAGLDPQAWNRWDAYRREIRKPIKPASVQAAQRKLAGFGAEQATVVEQSIAQGWTGLFELKAANGNGHAPPPRKTRYEQMQEALQNASET